MDVVKHKRAITEVFDRAAAEFDGSGVAFFGPIGRRVVELAGVRPGDAVLDIGCGRGAILFPAAGAAGPGGSVLGVDVAQGMVDAVRAEADRSGLAHVTAVVMDGERLRLGALRFDAILAGFSIMHMPSAPGVLGSYLRLLQPGGVLCFSDLVDEDGLPPFVPRPVFELLRPYFPAGPDPRERGRDSWSHRVEDIERALGGLGFDRVHVHEETFDMVLESGEQWIAWSMSTGLRAAWDNVPAADAAPLRASVAAGVERLRDAAGGLRLRVPVRYVTGRRPLDRDRERAA
ncbi:methyltransferase domain-containing protein [Dactylosporangium sp. AC04546]|uniref:class I SAM-dependent methyltransferase n=1 Tax=Dactylosporangium sp. AC04546 TaxID=2862460 RepID=UPI001EDF1E59|nr:methyltransferase domain-containing protein [Dactylosporangium sp. AC04546]WVK79060.1 methyltransferase domain-containing protein [Dactylosporangium sp. AC04546]